MSDEPRYAVGLVRTVPARRRRRIAGRLASRMGADPERIRALLGRRPGPITKPIAEIDAAQIYNYFVQEGIDVELIEIAPANAPDTFKTSTNLKLTSVVHRIPDPPSATEAWPDRSSWSTASGWNAETPNEQERNHAVRLIVRVPPQRIEGLIKRLAERLQVDPLRLQRLLSRPPGLLSKPISRATSERITSILSAEGVAVESVHLNDATEGGPNSSDFDLRLTLDMARMRAQVGDPTRAAPGGDASPRGHARPADEARGGRAMVIETPSPVPEPADRAVEAAPLTAPSPATPSGVADAAPAPPTEPPRRRRRARTEVQTQGLAATPAPDRPADSSGTSDEPPVFEAPPEPAVVLPVPPPSAAESPVDPDVGGTRPVYTPPLSARSEVEVDVEIPPTPVRAAPRSDRAAPALQSAPPEREQTRSRLRRGRRTPPLPAADSAAPGTAKVGAAAHTAGTAAEVTVAAAATRPSRQRSDPSRRGLYTLLAFDLGLIALLGSAGQALASPGGVTVLLLFSLLLLGQAMLARADRALSNLFAGLAVAPLFFMFPALVDTLSPWRELSADLQLLVVGLLLLLSTLLLADTLKLDRHRLGLALWHPDRSATTGGARVMRGLGAAAGGLILQLAIGASGLLVGVAALRFLPARPDGFGLSGTVPALALTALLVTGLAQELFFRGLLQRLGVRALGVPMGIGMAALLYVLLYAGGPLGGGLVFALLLALASGAVSQLSGSVLGLGLMNALALAVYLGLVGDPGVCLQGGLDLACLLPDLLAGVRGLP